MNSTETSTIMSYPGDRFICSDHSSTLVLFSFSKSFKLPPCTCQTALYSDHPGYTLSNAKHGLLFETWGSGRLLIFLGGGVLTVLVGDVDHHPCLWEPF